MAAPSKPGSNAVLLALGGAVLLVHLGLLQSMPIGLDVHAPAPDAARAFVTRSLAWPEPAPVDEMPQRAAPHKPAAPKQPRPAPQSQPAPDAPAPVADATEVSPSLPDASPPSTATTATPDGIPSDPLASAIDNASPPTPQATASAPEVGASEQVASAAPTPAPSSRHPRAKPATFQVGALSASTLLHYEVRASKFPLSLKGELRWQNLGDHYQARLGYSAFGLSRSQTSQGQITTAGLLPERFADKYRSEQAAHFNYPQGKITFSANSPDAELLSGAQDRLSVLLQLGALVAGEPARFTPGTTLSIQTVGAREADVWLFTFESSETLSLPGGKLQALKLLRLPRKPYDQRVEVWLAEQLAYLPARIRITDANGASVDQQWLSSEPLSTP